MKKAMGDEDVAHGLHSRSKCLVWHRADFHLFFLPAPPPIIYLQLKNIFHPDHFLKILLFI